MTDTARRDRMIAAYRKLADDSRRLPGRQYGTCKRCQAPIEWVRTPKGKMMPTMPNSGEPHFPHCGKNRWKLDDWDRHLRDIEGREARENARTPKPRFRRKPEHDAPGDGSLPWD